MQKIPNVFQRDWDTGLVVNKVHQDSRWVTLGEGIATRKWDGTCCLVQDGKLFKRRTVRPNKRRPPNFTEVQFDPATGKRFGWVPVNPYGGEDKWHREAFSRAPYLEIVYRDNQTYELIGPRINGNRDQFMAPVLARHGLCEYMVTDRSFDGLRNFLEMSVPWVEGLVFYHPDGRMAKIKRRDYGLHW